MNIVLVLKLRLKQTHIQGQANREEFGHAIHLLCWKICLISNKTKAAAAVKVSLCLYAKRSIVVLFIDLVCCSVSSSFLCVSAWCAGDLFIPG